MLTLWLASLLARATQVLRFRRFLLPFFLIFTLGTLTEESVYLWRFFHHERFGELQKLVSPYISGLRILAAFEAFWWLASVLPRFRKPAAGLFAISLSAAVWLSRDVGQHGGWLRHLEVSLAFGIVIFLGLTLILHKIIGTEHRSALWHSGVMGLGAIANGGGWYFEKRPDVGMWIMLAGQIAAAALWWWKVQDPPTWREPEPTVTPEEAREAIDDLRKAAGQ